MRALPLIMAALTLPAFSGLAGAQAPRAWFVEVSAARVSGAQRWYEDGGHMADDGASLNATVGRQVLPWLAVTGDVGVLRVGEVLLGIYIPEDFWTVDNATHTTFMTSVRLEPTLDSGLAPSLEIGTGLGWLHWGDRHVTSILPGGEGTVAGHQEVAWGLVSRVASRLRDPEPGVPSSHRTRGRVLRAGEPVRGDHARPRPSVLTGTASA